MRTATEYSEEPVSAGKLRDKLGTAVRQASGEVLRHALQLYFAARSPETPAWARSVIYGALGYFISVFDAVPDFTPVMGYTDDLSVLAAALATVATYVGPEERRKARAVLARLGLDPDA